MESAIDAATKAADRTSDVGIGIAFFIFVSGCAAWVLYRLFGKDGLAVELLGHYLSISNASSEAQRETVKTQQKIVEYTKAIEASTTGTQDDVEKLKRAGLRACDVVERLISEDVLPTTVKPDVAHIREALLNGG